MAVAVIVFRWAKDHSEYDRIAWISGILPLEKFTEICRKVYFVVDDHSVVDFIIANGYLSYIFAEHVVITGYPEYREHSQLCSKNLQNYLARLPLIMTPSMVVVAALTIGAFDAIQDIKATMAWIFISAASTYCQILGYHQLRSAENSDPLLSIAQECLFWSVYKFEKNLSLRLSRASNIRDSDITLPLDSDAARPARVASIQGKVYDQLYSPMKSSRS
ncbi:hypothetical protein BJ170DRAFT_624479 [Xylariales sp. AK1849]|nr:hypothetical protein BJ170DRAFT_624479 [Xylariales sp. AK1849]